MLGSIHSVQNRPMFGSVEITANIRERHSMSADMPTVPIELGSDFQDHRQIHPIELVIEGVISSVAMRSDGQIDERGRVLRGNALLTRAQPYSIQEGYTRLQELFDGSGLFEVTTSLRTYRNMHFTTLDVVRDKSTGGIISFSATLRQVTFARTATARVRSRPEDKPKTTEKKKPGAKKARPATDNRTTAKKIAEKATGSKKPGQVFKRGLQQFGETYF